MADLTYVRLRWEFVYVAVILDAFSRRVVGYALSRSLEASLTVAALRAALADRRPPPGCIHHSDRGVQYACDEYVKLLTEAGLRISMARRGNAYDNAQAESFFKTLKHEEVNLSEYRNLEQAAGSIGAFIEQIYNPPEADSTQPWAICPRPSSSRTFTRRWRARTEPVRGYLSPPPELSSQRGSLHPPPGPPQVVRCREGGAGQNQIPGPGVTER